MIRGFSRSLVRYEIHAQDGILGKLDQLFFDDQSWTIRYLVVNTAGWLSKRDVLLSPMAVTLINDTTRQIQVNLSKKQIENCPPSDQHMPYSRKKEKEYSEYFKWPSAWGRPTDWWEVEGYDSLLPGPAGADVPATHDLRTTREVEGYRIHALDGEFGKVEDFLLDDHGWIIRYFMIDTHRHCFGKRVLVGPRWVKSIDWGERQINVDLRKDRIQDAPSFDPNGVLDRAYEERLHQHYGQRPYWNRDFLAKKAAS